MKKNLIIVLTFAMILILLAACGSEKHEPTVVVETPAPAAETAKPVQSPAVQTAEPEPVETAEPEQTSETIDDEKYQTALGLIDADVEDLYKAIGYPESKDYGPSCLGDYDLDGQLDYEGFSLFTLVQDGVETIVDGLRDDEF